MQEVTPEAAVQPRRYPFHHGRDTVIAYPVTGAGVTTRVVESGSGDNILVCLHGAGSRADRFVPVMPGLVAAGYRVLAIDFPGHGFAEKRDDIDYSAAGFADVIAGVLDSLDLSKVTVVGTSLGGHVAAHLAVHRTDLVKALVLIGAVGVGDFPQEFHTPPEVLSDGSVDGVRRKLTFLVSDPEMVTDAWVREESMINSSTGAKAALLKVSEWLDTECNDARVDTELASLLPGLPVLLVWGADDKWTPPSMGMEAQKNLPGAPLELMPGCGHAPYFEDPDAFVEILIRHRVGLD
ncbi:alpha/beta fold hydrolase [Mycobacterium sp. 4D054]|uniref:alpha/beta fold hydrolase n=1 Tax=unclassified Mycobacterium TaxID=2642494 RepID=UPI0021B3BE42|nr:alpha/beta hydrolase [Mycobacterium sp. SMC-8]UXA12604.1 alpha/beta hydrolase [Mycobacterium sp. SMC-8]